MDKSLQHTKDELFLAFRVPFDVMKRAEKIRKIKLEQDPHNSNYRFKKNFYLYIIGEFLRKEEI